MCLSLAIKRPDDVLNRGDHKGFEWVVMHNGKGFRCGYVRIPKDHPWHGKHYSEIDPEVHGGLTFSESDEPCDKRGNDDAWWIGFDCCHSGDAPDPALPNSYISHLPMFIDPIVRTQKYVESECLALCEQAGQVQL